MRSDVKKIGRAVFAGAIACTCFVALHATSPKAEAGRVFCPAVYAPVLCPNGHVYSNSCWASVAGQTGCVPTGNA